MNFDKLRKGVAEAGDLVLADLLLRTGAATPDQVREALEEKERTPGLNVAQILLKKGAITTEQYVAILRGLEEARPTPKRIGRYVIEEELARGGMGIVYRAMDPDLKRPVAVKVIKSGDGDGESGARLRREAQAAARLRHPNVVAVHEVGEDGGNPFLVMDLVEGTTLRRAGAGRWAPERLAGFLADVASALGAAHAAGIVHRDLKPENVLVDTGGRPRVSDFGLARLDSASRRLTKSHEVMGTPLYMAPEQMTGRTSEIGPCTDIYAMGVMLYEALAGRLPYDGDTFVELCRRALEGDPVRPRKLRPEADADLEAVALKAMAVAPRDRYPDAAALEADLRRRAAGEPVEARPPSGTARILRKVRRHKAASAIGGVAVLAVVAALAVGLAGRRREDDLERRLRESIRGIEELADRAIEKFEYAQMSPPRPMDAEEDELRRTLLLIEKAHRDNPGAHEARVAGGRIQAALGRYAESLATIDEGISKLGDRAQGRHYLARALARMTLLAQPPYRLDAFTPVGGKERRRALLEALRADLDRAGTEASPARAAFVRGLSALASGDTGGACAACDEVARDPGATPVLKAEALRLRGDACWQVGRKREALESYEGARGIKRSDRQILFDIAWLLSDSTNSEAGHRDGLEIADQALVVAPGWAPAWLVKAMLWTGIGRGRATAATDAAGAFAEAEAAFERALRLSPRDPMLLGYRAYFHYSRGTWKQLRTGARATEDVRAALEDADAAIAGLPHQKVALYARASARAMAAQEFPGEAATHLEGSLRDYDELVAAYPDTWSTVLDRADVQRIRANLAREPAERREAVAAGIRDAERAIALRPTEGRSHWMRGKLLALRVLEAVHGKSRDPESEDAALASLDEALRLDPRDAVALVERGNLRIYRTLLRQERAELDAALLDLAAAASLAPGLATAHATYAQALQLAGQPVQAVAAYERAFAIDPTLQALLAADYEKCKASVK